MARAPIREVSQPAAIRGQASPINTFVQAERPAPSNLHALAEGLASVDSGLQSFLQKRNNEKDDADKIRGEAAFNAANQVGWAEAVSQGLVPPNASPIFMRAYKGAQGNLQGIRLREKFNREYLEWEGRNSDDPAAFQEFLGTFVANNIATEDIDILRGLNPHIEALSQDAMEVWGKEQADAAYSGAVGTNAAISGDTIDYANADGLSSGSGTDYEGLSGELLAHREEALASGIRKEDYDAQFVATIAAKAIEHEDPQLLSILDQVLPGYDVKLSSLPQFRDVKRQTIEKLESLARKRMSDQWTEQERIDQEKEDGIVRGITGVLAVDPLAEIPEEIIKEWEKYDPKARTTLADIRKKLIEGEKLENPSDLLAIERAIQEGATLQDIIQMSKDGIIADAATLRTAVDRVEKRRKARLTGSGILTTQTSRRFASTIKERTTPDMIGALFAPEGLTDEGLEAMRDYELMLIEWEEQNPNASLKDREAAINEIGELILKRIDSEERSYTSEEDARRIRAEAQSEAPTEEEIVDDDDPPEEDNRAGSRETFNQEAYEAFRRQETIRLYSGDEPPSLESLDPNHRAYLEEEAAKVQLTPEEFNVKVWQRLKEMMGVEDTPLNPSPTSGENQELGDLIDNAVFRPGDYTDSPPEVRQASPILNMIGHTEGTDRARGYNETLGYGAYTGGDVELTSMTLGEIDKLQTQMLRHPKNKWNSSALGRYQIVRTTLRKLKKKHGLTDDMKFDRQMQDRLGMILLKGRGYDRWKAGRMSDKAFMNSIAKEWASLPTDKGKGHYKGQHAGIDPKGVLTAFAATRGKGSDPFGALLNPPKAYANIPKDEVQQFVAWNSDPIANHEKNLKSVDAKLADVVRKAQEYSPVEFVVGSGKRSKELQAQAVEWGWSRTNNSDHLHGGAVDLWPLDENDAVKFDRKLQLQIVEAMRKAAEELGVDLDIGADWRRKDYPHFAIK